MIVRLTVTGISLLLLIMAISTTSAVETDTRDPREYFFTHSFGDLPDELQTARDEGKLGMLLFFEAEACPYCEHMLRNIFNQKSVQDWYQPRFVSIAVDIHGDIELKDFDGITLPSKIFSDHRKIFLTPVMSFIDLNGIEVYRHLGMIKTPEEFLTLGKYIEEEHFFDTEYKIYLESQGMPDSGERMTTPTAKGDAR